MLSKGTLHWKNILHLEHAARQSREKLYGDLAKFKYAAILQEGESSLPTLTATSSSSTGSPVARSEGWALKQAKQAYRFNLYNKFCK